MDGIVVELLAQLEDGVAEELGLFTVLRAPDGAEDHGVRDHAAGMRGQVFQHLVFGRREVERLARQGHQAFAQIDLEVAAPRDSPANERGSTKPDDPKQGKLLDLA